MDFKILVSCEKCNCSFELRPEFLKDRPSAECPNCGLAFPDDVYEQLKVGVAALGSVPECVQKDAGAADKERLFTVRVKSYGVMHDLLDNHG